MTKKKEVPVIRCTVYFVIKEYDFKKHGNRHREQLRMVAWNDNEPTIERRQMILGTDGQFKVRKARGLTKEDFELIDKHKDKIQTVWKDYFDNKKESHSI